VYVGIGQTVTYRLVVDNDNDLVTNNISLIDVLSAEVDFVSASLGGIYRSDLRSCIWTFDSLVPGENRSVDLVVRVNSKAVPLQAVTNTFVAESDETPPAQASVQFIPHDSILEVLNLELLYSEQVCEGCSDKLQAILTLPPEVKLADVNPNEMLVLEPGGARATQIVYGRDGKVKMRAFFDTAKLLESVDGYGRVTVTVQGWLRSGRGFVGHKGLLITSGMRHKG